MKRICILSALFISLVVSAQAVRADNLDSEPGDADTFLDQYPADFTIIRDADGVLARQFEVAAMPTSYVVDRDGHIIARHLGFKVKKIDEYEDVIRAAIAAVKE